MLNNESGNSFYFLEGGDEFRSRYYHRRVVDIRLPESVNCYQRSCLNEKWRIQTLMLSCFGILLFVRIMIQDSKKEIGHTAGLMRPENFC